MNEPRPGARRAEDLVRRLGQSYDHVLGARFSINVFIATIIVVQTLSYFGNDKPIGAIASMVASSEPEPEEARRLFRSRVTNVLVGCGVGSKPTGAGNVRSQKRWGREACVGSQPLDPSQPAECEAPAHCRFRTEFTDG